jgi:hypothetical protein
MIPSLLRWAIAAAGLAWAIQTIIAYSNGHFDGPTASSHFAPPDRRRHLERARARTLVVALSTAVIVGINTAFISVVPAWLPARLTVQPTIDS